MQEKYIETTDINEESIKEIPTSLKTRIIEELDRQNLDNNQYTGGYTIARQILEDELMNKDKVLDAFLKPELEIDEDLRKYIIEQIKYHWESLVFLLSKNHYISIWSAYRKTDSIKSLDKAIDDAMKKLKNYFSICANVFSVLYKLKKQTPEIELQLNHLMHIFLGGHNISSDSLFMKEIRELLKRKLEEEDQTKANNIIDELQNS
ncbi:hypothetical protein NEOKW01_1916 [Nematocida sp. AWRm80]|nr:hypothetical protein NEOKW01_1916 [Nematocida sp. AWRm80]